jgi:hypothetical protein
VDDFVPAKQRAQLWELPSKMRIMGREVEIEYDVEEQEAPVDGGAASAEMASLNRLGVARLRLPEKLARTISAEDLPEFDRPLRFVVARGQRGALRANTLEELQEQLEGPWTPNEAADDEESQPRDVSDRHAAQGGRKSHGGQRGGSRGGSRGNIPRGGGKFGRSGGPKRGGRRR